MKFEIRIMIGEDGIAYTSTKDDILSCLRNMLDAEMKNPNFNKEWIIRVVEEE